jgi:hypothetical protein
VLGKYRPTIWAAWGTLIGKRDCLSECLSDIAEIADKYSCRWISFGKVTKYGHPHHPLYLSGRAPYNEFLINEYLEQ